MGESVNDIGRRRLASTRPSPPEDHPNERAGIRQDKKRDSEEEVRRSEPR